MGHLLAPIPGLPSPSMVSSGPMGWAWGCLRLPRYPLSYLSDYKSMSCLQSYTMSMCLKLTGTLFMRRHVRSFPVIVPTT